MNWKIRQKESKKMSLIDFNDDDESSATNTTELTVLNTKLNMNANKHSSLLDTNLIDMNFSFEVKNPLFNDDIFDNPNQQQQPFIELKHREISIENLFAKVGISKMLK